MENSRDDRATNLEERYAAERAKRLRSDGADQYQALSGEFTEFARDPRADTDFNRAPYTVETDVVIVGGGYAGLLVAYRLRARGINDCVLIEKGTDVGGTWYWNRYPGAACDIDSTVYLPLLEELGYMPSEKYAKAPEIFAHSQRIATACDVYDRALFQTSVTEAQWCAKNLRWTVRTDHGDTISARFLVSCTGLFSVPKLPGIPGIKDFNGRAFHTSRWDYAYTGNGVDGDMPGLRDKTVAIVGTGSTGIQCAPSVARSAGHLHVVQRTPSTIDRRDNKPIAPDWVASLEPGWSDTRRKNFTALTSGGDAADDLIRDAWTQTFSALVGPGSSQAHQQAEMLKMEELRARVDTVVNDPTTAESLKPYYHYMCKRPGFSDEYLQMFNQKNVSLLDTQGRGVERVTPNGIVIAGKEYALDCLIFATGFNVMQDYVRDSGFDPVGRDGRRLSEHWQGGRRTLFGMQTHGFPNFFMVSPAQSAVSLNYIHMADEQATHIAYIISTCLTRAIGRVEPDSESETAWVREVIERSAPRRAFLSACTPGYYNSEGKLRPGQDGDTSYDGDPIAFFRRLEEWRDEGTMQGLLVD